MLTDEDLFRKKDPVAWIMALSFFVHLSSFLLPTYGDPPRLYGWQAFLVGLSALFDDGIPVWLANPAYRAAYILYCRGKTKVAFPVLSILACALSLTLVFQLSVHELAVLREGYYVWLSSHFLLLAASAGELLQRVHRRWVSKGLSWRQFTLRALFVITGIVAVLLAVVIVPINRLRQQRKAVSAIQALNGQVAYDPGTQSPRSRLRWFARSIYGDDIFRYVVRADMGGRGASVSDSDLRYLASLDKLESLTLENAQLSGAGADPLSNLRSLTHLTISDSVVAEGTFERLQQSPALRELVLRRVPLSNDLLVLDELRCLRNVRVFLTITSTLSTNEMATLTEAQNIHTLRFDRVRVPPETWTHMGRVGRLRRLSFRGMSLPGSAFEAIGQQTQLHVLSMQNVRATDDAWAKMPKLEKLGELMLHDMVLSVPACEAIGRQSRLHYLNLNDTSIADGGLASVNHLKDLETLALHRTAVTAEDLRQMQELRQLARLELHATKVSDETCDTLRQMTNLRSVDLTHTLVTRKSVDQLREDLPDCRVKY
jgi:hypothetical protein